MHGAARIRLMATPAAIFADFAVRAGGDEAARARFQLLVSDLVATKFETVREVAGPGGSDWGIDAYVGEFNGTITVWQAKFFRSWAPKLRTGPQPSQRGQVRESFNEVMQKAADRGFKVDQWTLCAACDLPPDEQTWFDGWKGRKQREYGVRIDLVSASGMRRWLLKPDSDAVADWYFREDSMAAIEPIGQLADPGDLSGALFVRQLEEAGHSETDAARGLFFAAEALARSLKERGDEEQLQGLRELQMELHSLWEEQFNGASPAADAQGRLAGLVERVLAQAAALDDPAAIRLRPTHRRGMVHRLVEEAKAGWVVHWREVARSHDGSVDLDSLFTESSAS